MLTRWRRLMDDLRTGFWFMPLIMLSFAVGLALVLLYVDERVDPGIRSSIPWAYSGGPEGARLLLSTIAGSMITAASVTFSLAAVALSIASQQYGSRVLRNFMRDRITQVLLGTFLSTFIYSLLVVRAIRGSDYSGGFVPAISVTVAIGLSVASLVLLIFFIHHVSASIQASRIIRVIAEDMAVAIPKLDCSPQGSPIDQAESARLAQIGTTSVSSASSGYLQTIDLQGLVKLTARLDLFIENMVKPGDHIVSGNTISRIFGSSALKPAELRRVVSCFIFGGERTPAQDIRFQFQQLTDVIIRALSPGINDPFTAVNGIDELETAALLFMRHGRADETLHDHRGVPRVRVPTPSLEEVLEETVGHIAIYAAGDRFVMAALRRVLRTINSLAGTEQDLATVAHLEKTIKEEERPKLV